MCARIQVTAKIAYAHQLAGHITAQQNCQQHFVREAQQRQVGLQQRHHSIGIVSGLQWVHDR